MARERLVVASRCANAAAQKEMAEGYEIELRRLEAELNEKIAWGMSTKEDLETQLSAASGDLAGTVEMLHQNEALVEERTNWAQSLDVEVASLKEQLAAAGQSKWIKLGRKFGFGPHLS